MNEERKAILVITGMVGMFALATISIIYFFYEDNPVDTFYEERKVMRDVWDCKTIEAMIYPTGKWEHREYANSLWIVKGCWNATSTLGDDSK